MVPHPRMMPKLVSGQRFSACGQSSSARVQIILRGAAWQCTNMCSMDSVTLHVLQNSRCSLFSMCRQYFPTFWVPCMALYRNCLMRVRSACCRIPDHIVSSVSSRPLYPWIASLVVWRFSEVVGRYGSKVIGTFRVSASGMSLSAPILASRSHSSFPWSPSWPLIHLKWVVAVRLLRRWLGGRLVLL